jgi:hypothetical protein
MVIEEIKGEIRLLEANGHENTTYQTEHLGHSKGKVMRKVYS